MLTYNGVNLKDHFKVNDVGRSILPPQELKTRTIAGRHGAFLFGKRHRPRSIPIKITVVEETNASYQNTIDDIAFYLDQEEAKPLVFNDVPDRYINAILEDESMLNKILSIGQGEFNMFCPDPFYYAVEDEIFTFDSEGELEIVRQKGNLPSNPLIEIKGTNSNGEIIVSSQNTRIAFSGVLNDGAILTMDSNLLTAYTANSEGDQTSAIDDLDSLDFPILNRGLTNLSIRTTGDASISEIRITANSRWSS